MGELRSARASRPRLDGDKDDHTKVMLMLNSTAWEKRLEEARVQRKMALAAKASRNIAVQDGSSPSQDEEPKSKIKATLFVARESKETGEADSSNGASGQQQIRESGGASLPVAPDRLQGLGLDQLRVVEPQPASAPQREEIDVPAKSSANIDNLAAAMLRARTPNSAEINDTGTARTDVAELPVTRQRQRTIVRPAMVAVGFALGLALGLGVAVIPQYLRSPDVAEMANVVVPATTAPQTSRSPFGNSAPAESAMVESYSSSIPVASDTIEGPEVTGSAMASTGLPAMLLVAPGELSPPLQTSAASLSASMAPTEIGVPDHELPALPSLWANTLEPQAPDFDTVELKLLGSSFDPSPDKILIARLDTENSLALAAPLVPMKSPNRALAMANGYADGIPALAVPVGEASVQIGFERLGALYVQPKQVKFLSSVPARDQAPAAAEVPLSKISATDIQGALLPLAAGGRGAIPFMEDNVIHRAVPETLGQGSVVEASLLPVYAPPEALVLRPAKRPSDVLAIAAISVFAPRDVPEDQLDQLSASLADEGFQLDAFARVNFGISETNVRYYHREDEAVAVALAEHLGAKVRDFTSKDKLPAVGRVELWVAGDTTKTVRPQTASKQKKSKSSRQRAAEDLRLQVISKLKEASSQ